MGLVVEGAVVLLMSDAVFIMVGGACLHEEEIEEKGVLEVYILRDAVWKIVRSRECRSK